MFVRLAKNGVQPTYSTCCFVFSFRGYSQRRSPPRQAKTSVHGKGVVLWSRPDGAVRCCVIVVTVAVVLVSFVIVAAVGIVSNVVVIVVVVDVAFRQI